MSLKDALTHSLLMFVAATCVVLIVKALPQTSTTQVVASVNGGPAAQGAVAASADIQDGVMVYYLHGNIRCPTCRTIEALTEESLQTGFADDLRSGKLRWQVINYETPGNEHYAFEYEVVAPSVVLAMFKDGKRVKWKSLPDVWDHVGNKMAFIAFVQTSLREFVGESNAAVAASPQPQAPRVVPSLIAPVRVRPSEDPAVARNPMRQADESSETSPEAPLPIPE